MLELLLAYTIPFYNCQPNKLRREQAAVFFYQSTAVSIKKWLLTHKIDRKYKVHHQNAKSLEVNCGVKIASGENLSLTPAETIWCKRQFCSYLVKVSVIEWVGYGYWLWIKDNSASDQ